MGEACPVDVDPDGNVDSAGFLFGAQGAVEAVIPEGVVKDVDVDGQDVVAREPDEPVEGDACVGVLGRSAHHNSRRARKVLTICSALGGHGELDGAEADFARAVVKAGHMA